MEEPQPKQEIEDVIYRFDEHLKGLAQTNVVLDRFDNLNNDFECTPLY